MHPAIDMMLKQYKPQSLDDYTHALKEIIQQITLLGLWRSKFFEKAAFYGGTALRIFYQLNRFSEDLDFSLLEKDNNFKLDKYNEAIATELKAFGFEVEIKNTIKNGKSSIASTMIKANTKQQFLTISAPSEYSKRLHHQNKIKIKMEVDTYPPLNFNTEVKTLLNPIPFEVNLYGIEDLFATKLHAILCRSWGTRVKGRDWFDLIWYVTHDINLGIPHLETRLRESQLWNEPENLTIDSIRQLLLNRIDQVNFLEAKQDVSPFIQDQSILDLWSKSFFQHLVEKLR